MAPTGTVPETLRRLLTRIVDYAGLFPPAQLGMGEAVRNYAEYRTGSHEWMLGRFVLPVTRLDEFAQSASALLPRGEDARPWELSALIGSDVQADVERILNFNSDHASGSERGHAVIDAAELSVQASVEIRQIAAHLPAAVRAYFEFPLQEHPRPFVEALAETRAAAKARTGGVTAGAIPSAEHVLRFLSECLRARVRFKATAGLHHPVRGDYPLTYEPDAACGMMFGYLNVFLAAAVLVDIGSGPDALGVLTATDLGSLEFDDAEVRWGEQRISLKSVTEARKLAIAFGSCSFHEPVHELTAVRILS